MVEIKLHLTDVEARYDAEYNSNYAHSRTFYDILKDNRPAYNNIAILEKDFFILDGSKNIAHDTDLYNLGYITKYPSNNQGIFDTIPNLTITFGTEHTSKGITLQFEDNHCPNKISVKWYDKNNHVIQSTNVQLDNPYYYIDISVSKYKKIIIDFLSTHNSNRYIILSKIFYGELIKWDNNVLSNVKVLEEINPVNNTLPISTLNFNVIAENIIDDFDNKDSILNYLSKQQLLEVVYKDYDNNIIKFKNYYIDNWTTNWQLNSFGINSAIFTINCIDVIGILDNKLFDTANIYNGHGPHPDDINTIINLLMRSAKFTNYIIDYDIGAEFVEGFLPLLNCRDALQQVLIATNATVTYDDKYEIVIKHLDNNIKARLTYNDIFISNTITQKPLITEVSLIKNKLDFIFDENAGGYNEKLWEGTLTTGIHLISFDNYMYTYSITGNAQMLYSGVNYCKLEVYNDGIITLYGQRINLKKEHIYKRAIENNGNKVEIQPTYLLSELNQTDILEYIYNYYQNRLSFKFSMYNDKNIRAGDLITLSTDKQVFILRVESVMIDLSKGLVSDIIATTQPRNYIDLIYCNEISCGESVGII